MSLKHDDNASADELNNLRNNLELDIDEEEMGYISAEELNNMINEIDFDVDELEIDGNCDLENFVEHGNELISKDELANLEDFVDQLNENDIDAMLCAIMARKYKYQRRSIVVRSDQMQGEEHDDLQELVLKFTGDLHEKLNAAILSIPEYDFNREYDWDWMSFIRIRHKESEETTSTKSLYEELEQELNDLGKRLDNALDYEREKFRKSLDRALDNDPYPSDLD